MAERTGLGTKFQRKDGLTFEDIAQVVSISPPQLTRETVDVEELAPDDDFKRKLVGLIDGGEFSVILNFDPEEETQLDLKGDFEAGEKGVYRIWYGRPEGIYEDESGYCEISGIVTGFAQQEITAGDVMQAEVTIAVTGKPDYKELEELEEG